MVQLFDRIKRTLTRIWNQVFLTRTVEEKTTTGGWTKDPDSSRSTGSGEMPRAGKSKPSKKSSEFNQLDYGGLSWDSLIDDSVPPVQEQKSSATSKPASVSRKTPSSSPSITSLTKSDEPLADWERELLAVPPYQPMPRSVRAETEAEQRMRKVLAEVMRARLRSTTTTPDGATPPDSNGLPGMRPHSSGISALWKSESL